MKRPKTKKNSDDSVKEMLEGIARPATLEEIAEAVRFTDEILKGTIVNGTMDIFYAALEAIKYKNNHKE